MGFLLRAALVIGVIAYLTAPNPPPVAKPEPSLAERAAALAPQAVEALPPELRERLLREAAAGLSASAHPH
jgi:hypothetical protein